MTDLKSRHPFLGTQERETDSLVDTSEEQTSVAGDLRERSRLLSCRPEEQTPVGCTLEREEDTTVDRPEEQTTTGAL